ncbi:hypothetical protein ISN45_At01g021530 [Arabidopsis thaliana x Arabidopsis arenosa]|uniref:Uncharacterized protein n=2 Tax=Arabidopsis TaxID=3701 RepID=A0A8T2H4F5_ARASU|nr:hypothetical protein ISN45_At01g021530 [Arabidopsis thaliana x Arabidopsis arenosa]KAG7655059.1 hypothetical protein ISN44_As01g021640 [Arabidopsis suecica]
MGLVFPLPSPKFQGLPYPLKDPAHHWDMILLVINQSVEPGVFT